MTALDTASHPYPEGTTLVRPFAPAPVAVDVPSSAAVVPPPVPSFTPVAGEPLDVREPGANYGYPVPLTAQPDDLVLLDRVHRSLKRLPRRDEAIYAGAFSEHHGTAPRPVLAPVADLVPPRPSLAEDLARYRLAEIVYAAARHAEPLYGPYCPDCKASPAEWCDRCADAEAKSDALDRLHDLILAADSFATAVVLAGRSLLAPKVVHVEGRR